MPYKKAVNESDSVLSMQRFNFPVNITVWILEESGNVLECSPFLCHVSGLPCGLHELGKITISFLGQSSK